MGTSSLLLPMPYLPLQAVIRCLDGEDKRSLAGTCRQLAAAVSAASSSSVLTVTPSTGWQGLCKVLSARIITCTRMAVSDKETLDHQTANADSALDLLLKSSEELGCSFPGMRQLVIDARPLRSLSPVNIASCLPDLEELEIKYKDGQFVDDDDLQPLLYCSSLRKLSYTAHVLSDTSPQLPSKYHTAEDLRRQLPNIDSLTLESARIENKRSLSCINTMFIAWGSQLTKLQLKSVMLPVQLQLCTRLQSLSCYTHYSGLPTNFEPITFLPPSLASLVLDDKVTESQLQAILQLPALRMFSTQGFQQSLQQDWSQHPCTWQTLKIGCIPMLDLCKLPLHSLEGEGSLIIEMMYLPNPLLPDSLFKVQHAAQHVRNASIMIEGCDCWMCEGWGNKQEDEPGFDTALAELIRAASTVVQPCECLMHHHEPKQPQTDLAVYVWAAPMLREIHTSFTMFADPPLFFQALQYCRKLERVKIDLEDNYDSACVMWRAVDVAVHAAQQYVAVTRRPLTLVMKPYFDLEYDCQGDTDDDDRHIIVMNHEEDIDAAHVEMKLQQELPSYVGLVECTWAKNNMIISLKPMF